MFGAMSGLPGAVPRMEIAWAGFMPALSAWAPDPAALLLGLLLGLVVGRSVPRPRGVLGIGPA